MASYLCTVVLLALCGLSKAAKQPNFLFILTDDQDKHMNSVDYMQALKNLVQNEGTTYPQHYCTVAVCCPSRANLWSGRAAHNTNVTDIAPPYGGYDKVVSQGINDNYLPIWLQDAGYNTYYTGKLWNHFNKDTYRNPPSNGWTGSDISVDPTTYFYFNSSFSRNGNVMVNYEGQYSPDIVASKSSAFLDDAIADIDNKPFFLVAAPVAPHAELTGPKTSLTRAPQWAARFDGLFSDYQIPRGDNFNPVKDNPSASWIKFLPRLNDTIVKHNDWFQKARMRALQAVDEMIDDLVTKLDDNGLLDNTYVIFTTDNGFHISQHRMLPGKMCAIEEDINIPLIIRGPGIAKGAIADGVVSSHTDLAPTIMQLAGAGLRDEFDGSPIPLTPADIEASKKTEHVNVEYWGTAHPAGIIQYENQNVLDALENNTYKAIRVIGDKEEYNLFYSVWCTNEHEFYDMTTDPGQMTNLFKDDDAAANFKLAGRKFKVVAERLDALTMVLKTCQTDSCRKPWEVLHPSGKVTSLKQALKPKYDDIYKDVPKVSYSECAQGYIPGLEGPKLSKRDMFALWPDWT